MVIAIITYSLDKLVCNNLAITLNVLLKAILRIHDSIEALHYCKMYVKIVKKRYKLWPIYGIIRDKKKIFRVGLIYKCKAKMCEKRKNVGVKCLR